MHAAPEEARLIKAARGINDAQPAYVVRSSRMCCPKPEGSSIAVLGLAYKANVDDVRESPALEVVRLLEQHGYDIRLHDAHVSACLMDACRRVISRAWWTAPMQLLILTDHDEYRQMDPGDQVFARMARRLVVDTRYCIDRTAWDGAGFQVKQLGVGIRSAEPTSVVS